MAFGSIFFVFSSLNYAQISLNHRQIRRSSLKRAVILVVQRFMQIVQKQNLYSFLQIYSANPEHLAFVLEA